MAHASHYNTTLQQSGCERILNITTVLCPALKRLAVTLLNAARPLHEQQVPSVKLLLCHAITVKRRQSDALSP